MFASLNITGSAIMDVTLNNGPRVGHAKIIESATVNKALALWACPNRIIPHTRLYTIDLIIVIVPVAPLVFVALPSACDLTFPARQASHAPRQAACLLR
jgi:hypothetical protein